MIYPLRYYGDPILRQRARLIEHFDDDLRQLSQDMLETMYDAQGVGLAAPQIGLPLRIFVALEMGWLPDDASPQDPQEESWGIIAEHVMVNPEITARHGLQHGQDGCLSIPGLFVEAMPRDARITLHYHNLAGEPCQLEAEGHFAHVIQHELDHLDGILFFDRLPEAEKRNFLEAHRRELADMQRQAKALLKQLKREALPARGR